MLIKDGNFKHEWYNFKYKWYDFNGLTYKIAF